MKTVLTWCKTKLKVLLYRLQLWDGIISIPLAYLFFIVTTEMLQKYYSYIDVDGNLTTTVGAYNPEILQAVIYSAFVIVAFSMVANAGIYFTFRGLFKYFYSRLSPIREDFKQMKLWLRVTLFFFVYFLYMFLLFLVFQTIV
jgi:hypothetical protein